MTQLSHSSQRWFRWRGRKVRPVFATLLSEFPAGRWLSLAVFICFCSTSGVGLAGEPSKRVAWTTSKFYGSPEPPPPYVLERAYPLEFSGPISINRLPDSDLMLVLEQRGRVFSFDSKLANPEAQLCADFNDQPPPHSGVIASDDRQIDLFSIAFHPQFTSNRHAYVCYITRGGGQPTDTHISRFEVVSGPLPRLKLATELKILECEGGGHNGCTLAFGPDGYLYVSLGDLASPNPPDPRNTGQDISDLYSSILRIDVDQADVDRESSTSNYGIPPDNPFVNVPGARGEVYCYGFRNPFRMAFDSETGDLWVGDVGWEAWEMVIRVRKGGNYGWSVTEGPGLVKQDQPAGPTPILPPDIALGHAEAASVTGGMVYRGGQFPELSGQYIFGDWITRKFWAVRFDAEKVIDYREIASSTVKPVCFESTADGELLVLDYAAANQLSGIYRFAPNPAAEEHWSAQQQGDAEQQQPESFPRRLSRSGLFADTTRHEPAPGVSTYQVNAPMWKDGASAEYLVAIPGQGSATFFSKPQKTFDWFTTTVTLPKHSVLAKTYSWDRSEQGLPPRRIETQIALKDAQGEWQYYTYRWNGESSDAELVEADGETVEIKLDAPSQRARAGEAPRTLTWQFASRTSCRVCHTPWRGETLGFVEQQLRRPAPTGDSWRALLEAGVATYEPGSKPRPDEQFVGLVDPHDTTQPLDLRARSYLHTNCAHCHLFGGNASTLFDVSYDKPLHATNMLDEPPLRGDLGLPRAKIVRPGSPTESILAYRVAKAGSGRMPHIGTQRVDPLAIALLQQWIARLPADLELSKHLDLLCGPYSVIGREQRLEAAEQLLRSAAGAMHLATAMAEDRVPKELIHEIVEKALEGPPATRDLLEPFAAEDQRLTRLGERINAQELLELKADPFRGREHFAAGVGSCSNCHRVAGIGKQIGPDLRTAAARLKSKPAILHSILQPSAEILPDFTTKQVLTVDGELLTGNLLEQTVQQITLRDVNGHITKLSMDEVESLRTSPVSLMPENLLAPLTAQQAADILAFVHSLASEADNSMPNDTTSGSTVSTDPSRLEAIDASPPKK